MFSGATRQDDELLLAMVVFLGSSYLLKLHGKSSLLFIECALSLLFQFLFPLVCVLLETVHKKHA